MRLIARLLIVGFASYRNKHTPTRESTATHVVKACFRANAADSALMFFANRPTYALFPSRHTLHLLLFRFAIEAATKPEAAEKGACIDREASARANPFDQPRNRMRF